jgi:ATP-dependent DNA helicase RecG
LTNLNVNIGVHCHYSSIAIIMPEKIIKLLSHDPNLTIAELAQQTGKPDSAINRAIRKLKESRQLERIGSDKGGYWKVMEH